LRKKNLLSILLLPISWIYGFTVFIRNLCFDLNILKQEEYDIPIISVGNISIGGTGKTPHIEYLIRLLQSDYKLAVLSRGYKRKTKGFILSDADSTADSIGDEPFQIKSKFPEIAVSVDADRRNGVRKLMDLNPQVDLILLDDAFQHRYVKPGLSILLVEYCRPITKDFLLPAGELRESATGRKRADIIIVSKCPENLTENTIKSIAADLNPTALQSLYFTKVIPKYLIPVYKKAKPAVLSGLNAPKPSVLLVSGIANPASLKTFASKISDRITELHFPDHHAFTAKDISRIISAFDGLPGDEKILITTEKDAARFQKFSDLPEKLINSMFYIPISIEFMNGDSDNFEIKIQSYVKKNTRNSFLHKGKN
jgi:tetraacyldisaccharide 4'-kinase